jgi:hypothetical protein
MTGLRTWLRADVNGTTATDGAAVTTWADQSGNGFVFQGPNPPIYKTGILNGKPVVRFDGVNDTLNVVWTGTPIMALASPYTIFTVVRIATVPAADKDIVVFSDAGQLWSGIIRRNATEWAHYNRESSANSKAVLDTVAVAAGEVALLAYDWDGVNVHLWRNGTLKATTAAGGGRYGGVGETWLGSFCNTANFLDGDIAEVLMYNVALSATDRQKTEAYLKGKYGIP